MYRIISYPETIYKYNAQSRQLEVALPWLNGQISLPEDLFHDQEDLSHMAVEDILNYNRQYFRNDNLPFLPFCQVMPRTSDDFTPSENESPNIEYTELTSASNLLKLIDPNTSLPSAIDYWCDTWHWNAEKVIDNARIDGTENIDPVSIYTAIRRLRNAENPYHKYATTLSTSLMDFLKNDEQKLFDHILWLLFQSYYITSHCVKSLTPALNRPELEQARMKSYIKEEDGHHKLVKRSIDVLNKAGHTIEDKAYPESRILMKVLKYCAANHALAFCCLIGAFEQTSQFASDPMADLLLQSSLPAAAYGIQKHFDINKQGGHSEVGLELSVVMPPVDVKEATFAIKTSEIYLLLLEGIAYRTISNLEKL